MFVLFSRFFLLCLCFTCPIFDGGEQHLLYKEDQHAVQVDCLDRDLADKIVTSWKSHWVQANNNSVAAVQDEQGSLMKKGIVNEHNFMHVDHGEVSGAHQQATIQAVYRSIKKK